MAASGTGATPRREPRHSVALNVRVFGLDAQGKPVNCECSTIDISASGARLIAAQQWRAGEIVGVRHGSEKGRFKIVWIGRKNIPSQWEIGLQAVDVSRHFWGVNLPQHNAAMTTSVGSRIAGIIEATPKPGRLGNASTSASQADHRLHARLRCNGGAKLIFNGVNHWATVIDISRGGCYIECPSTYAKGQLGWVKLGIDNFNFESDVIVRVSHPGMGMGLEFLRMTMNQRRSLEEFVDLLARDPNRFPGSPPPTARF